MSDVYDLRCNVIRPGYTFGDPVVTGASIYGDKRFETIVRNAKQNEPIYLVRDDGAQFIWAGDLARLYAAVLTSAHNRGLFTGVGTEFVTWEEVARMAIAYVGSRSDIMLEDTGKDRSKGLYDVSLIEREFGFKFVTRTKLKEHIAYIADHRV
jgi:UDP-glucose 4-epimerase